LDTFAFTFASVVFCAPLQLVAPFSGNHFGHVMSKACQYVTNDIKIGVGMNERVAKAQSALQKTITWTKNLGKGRQEWESTCKVIGLRPRKFKTLVDALLTP
jgi:hypothetical protein